jgi:hypothetical protein
VTELCKPPALDTPREQRKDRLQKGYAGLRFDALDRRLFSAPLRETSSQPA